MKKPKLLVLTVLLFCFVCPNVAWGATHYTNSNLVTLRMSFVDSSIWLRMRFSNDNKSWDSLEPLASVREDWDLTACGGKAGDGIKCVYLELQPIGGEWGKTISACLILDTIPPTGTIKLRQ